MSTVRLLPPVPRRVHVHRFRHRTDDPFSGAVLYACRCGIERPAL